jgi:hypothetical protein
LRWYQSTESFIVRILHDVKSTQIWESKITLPEKGFFSR